MESARDHSLLEHVRWVRSHTDLNDLSVSQPLTNTQPLFFDREDGKVIDHTRTRTCTHTRTYTHMQPPLPAHTQAASQPVRQTDRHAETLKHTLKQEYTKKDKHTHAQRPTLGDRHMELVRQTDTG